MRTLGNVGQDLRYALRVLRKDLTFTLTSLAGLGLGIALSTGVFTMINAFVLRHEPIVDPDKYVGLYTQDPRKRNFDWFTYSEYTFLREHATTLQSLTAWSARFNVTWTAPASPNGEDIEARLASWGDFLTKSPGIRLGRGFLPEEDSAAHPAAVVVLNPLFWESRLGADTSILGKTLSLNGRAFTVVGVAERTYSDQNDGEVYVPVATMTQMVPGAPLPGDPWRGLSLRGRLKPGVSVEQAQSELTALLREFSEARRGGVQSASVSVLPGGEFPGKRREILIAMLSALAIVGMILLIACANTANLLLARAAARQKEIGIRLSLGAGRRRLIQQLLTESLVLACTGGFLGLLLSSWLVKIFAALAKVPAGVDLFPDLRVYAYAAVISLVSGVAFGLAPALQASRLNLSSALKREGATDAPQYRELPVLAPRNLFIAIPFTLSLILLTGAGLVLRDLQRSYVRDGKVDVDNLVSVSFDPAAHGYNDVQAAIFEQRLSDRIQHVPGVRSAALVRGLPVGNGKLRSTSVAVEGWQGSAGEELPRAGYNVVSPEYFKTAGIPVLRGRAFSAMDTSASPGVVLINEDMSRRFWPGEDPIGKRFRTTLSTPLFEVIGVVKDDCMVKNVCDDFAPPEPAVYVPLAQAAQFSPADAHVVRQMQLLVRLDRGVQAKPTSTRMAGMFRGEASALDANLRVVARPLSDIAADFLRELRAMVVLSSTLGSLALILAAIGIYGVVAYGVEQRTRELGIRIALGAQTVDVLSLVLKRSLTLIGIGVAVGLAGSWALSRAMGQMLEKMGGVDPTAFAGSSALLAFVAVMASYLPARRAASVDPVVALRED
jgi:putative ABC transport system permease protein